MRIQAGLLLLFVGLPVSACQERLHHPPAPEGVTPGAVRDRHGIWEYKVDDGEYRRWYPDGKLARTGAYIRGDRQGVFRNFALDGRTLTSDGTYLDNWRDGIWQFYDHTGQPYLTVRYAKEPKRVFTFLETQDYGNENGTYERYYPNGTLEEQGEFYSGYYQGPIRRYFRDGKTAMEGQFEKDDMVGRWRFYYPGGTLEREENYVAGKLHGVFRTYYETGDPYFETKYVEGREVGPGLVHPYRASSGP